jgi:translation initiation factor IF-2
VRSGSKYLQGLLGAATPAGPGPASTLRPPRRIFDAAPGPEVASPDSDTGAVRSVWAVGSQDLFIPRSNQAVPAIDQKLPNPVPTVSHIAGADPATASGDDLAAGAEEAPPFLAGPSRTLMHPVTDRPPAAAPAPPVSRWREDDPGSALSSDDARRGAVRRPMLDPPMTSSDNSPLEFAGAPRPGGGRPAPTRVRPQVTIGTIEVTVVPPSSPPAVPQIPVSTPAPVWRVAPAGRRGAEEAARMGSRRWFGAGQG